MLDARLTEILNFGASAESFQAVDDRVMGGISQSGLQRSPEGHGVFAGALSLEQNGGFASVRASGQALDLSPYTALVLRVRGDGKRYKLRLQDQASPDGVNHQVAFDTQAGRWQELAFPLDAFEPVWRGRQVRDAAPLARDQIRSVGLLISDKQEGTFRLDLDWLAGR